MSRVLASLADWANDTACSLDEANRRAATYAAAAELVEKMEQIERLSRTADRAMVDVPAMLGDIARAALARCGGAK